MVLHVTVGMVNEKILHVRVAVEGGDTGDMGDIVTSGSGTGGGRDQ